MSAADRAGMSANDTTEAGHAEPPEATKVPNSPTTAFAALSLSDESSTPSTSPFTPTHIQELDSATLLVTALDAAGHLAKPLIRSTGHLVPSHTPSEPSHHLLSWKVAEFAYRKSTSVGSELPTLARGLFTERIDGPSSSNTTSSSGKHRIVVRGYDKFFNLGEMPWTKPDSISHYTTAPYVLTFKENGCIIFIAALSPSQLVVTSKHSLGSIEGTETTHAQKGHEWLRKHLSSVGRKEDELAEELWRRNETAAFELCDDSFEEHVLEYSESRSGLHLHGLNTNSASFRTRDMVEVDKFANEWGFIPTRWLQLESLDEVQRVTAEIEQTGAWDGEPIEGFVIRTHMPDQISMERLKLDRVVSPPYAPGQAWFYKVKFDEPYLMYRDWRELARRMVKEKAEWEAKVASLPASSDSISPDETSSRSKFAKEEESVGEDDTTQAPPNAAVKEVDTAEPRSKAALKRERKHQAKVAAAATTASRSAAVTAGLVPPPPPQSRSKRPETLLFIGWCYDRLYGNPSLSIKPQPHLFATLAQNKGIIAMRNAFLSHLSTTASATSNSVPQTQEEQQDTREFTKTILTPIAVPGCGKTVLALALANLFQVGHVQSDEFKKKSGFLNAVERDLKMHAQEKGYVLFADKNNHLFQHRDDLISLSNRLSCPAGPTSVGKKSRPPPAVGRIRNIALAWDLDALPLNTLHRLCASRIEQRGDNHQTLVADPDPETVSGMKTHETVLWRFLEAMEAFGSGGKGEGGEGWGDASFDQVVRLSVRASAEDNLRTVVREVGGVLGWELRGEQEEAIRDALQAAERWKVVKQVKGGTAESKVIGVKDEKREPRYFGLAVELDVRTLLDKLLSPPSCSPSSIHTFYTESKSRLNLRPHITLVHHSNLSTRDQSATDANHKWSFYSSLLSNSSAHEAEFNVSFSTLLYEPGKLLTFPIDNVIPPASIGTRFHQLHYPDSASKSQRWTPHITLATHPDVRPYEANRVVTQWKAGQLGNIEVIHLPESVTVPARVFGMS